MSRALIALLCFVHGTARAEAGIDAWARWALTPKVWKGQTVRAPEPEPRPRAATIRVDSVRLPLHVHVAASDAHPPKVPALRRLRALELAYDTWLALDGRPVPFDGGQGGGIGFDLYLVPPARCADACSGSDGLAPLADFDTAETYALLADDLPESTATACVLRAVTEATLRARDPAEAASWLRASAELLAWQYGPGPCDGALAQRAQATPELGMLNDDPDSASAGVLWLALESERLGLMPSELVRDLWDATRQRSKDLVPPDRLRGSPDLWEVLRQLLLSRHVQLNDELIELGVARYFAGPSERSRASQYLSFATLPSGAAVPIAQEIQSAELPRYVRDAPKLRELGSAYVRVQLTAAARPEQLKLWLHGDLGPRWSLTVVRLDAAGRELGRVSAPARDVPSSYVPLVLTADTSSVLAVISALPRELPDADLRTGTRYGYELIVGRE